MSRRSTPRDLGHASGVKRARLLLAVGAVAAAAVIVVVVLVVTSGTSHPKSSSSTATRSVFAGVEQHGDTLGRPSAPVAITVFEDPQCPFCRQWSLDTLPTVIKRYVRTGRVKLVYRGIQIIGPNSVQGLVAIYAAGAQNKLWNMADALYRLQGGENSGWITDAIVGEAAAAGGADPAALDTASSAGAVAIAITEARRESVADAVAGTPTFLIERPPGLPKHLAVPALDPASFTAALDAALR